MIRLLICDDSDVFRAALRTTLAEQPEIAVVGEAADGQEAVDLALALSPDVILMGARMPALDGVEATHEIKSVLPDTRIVALTGPDEQDVVAAMLEAGATAHCVKDAPLRELELAVAGAAEPFVRLAHTLAKSANACGAAELVVREIAELTGGAGAAVYVARCRRRALTGFRGRPGPPAEPDVGAGRRRRMLPRREARPRQPRASSPSSRQKGFRATRRWPSLCSPTERPSESCSSPGRPAPGSRSTTG